MGSILALPVLILALGLQMAVVSRLTLLHGTADLILVILVAWTFQENVRAAWFWALVAGSLVSFVSAMPLFTPLLGYLIIAGFARLLQSRIWRAPILAMFITIFAGTIFQHLLSILALLVADGIPISWMDSLNLITLPSVLLNLFLSLPVYVLIGDLAKLVYPAEDEYE